MVNHHKGEVPNFAFKVDRSWRSSLERQLMESLRIDNEVGNLMNSRTEFGANSIPRVTANQPGDRDKDNKGRPRDNMDQTATQETRNKRPRLNTGEVQEAPPGEAHHGSQGLHQDDPHHSEGQTTARVQESIRKFFSARNY